MKNEQIIKKVNPIVGYIFNSARQLGLDNAPNSVDWHYLQTGTAKIVELVESEIATALARAEWKRVEDGLPPRSKNVRNLTENYYFTIEGTDGKNWTMKGFYQFSREGWCGIDEETWSGYRLPPDVKVIAYMEIPDPVSLPKPYTSPQPVADDPPN